MVQSLVQIPCPNCGAVWLLDEAVLPSGGGHVECSRCGKVFEAKRPAVAAVKAAPPGPGLPAPPPPQPLRPPPAEPTPAAESAAAPQAIPPPRPSRPGDERVILPPSAGIRRRPATQPPGPLRLALP